MIKNGEIIMCQDDVAQLCSQAKVAKQLAGQSLVAVAGGASGRAQAVQTPRCVLQLSGRDFWIKWELI